MKKAHVVIECGFDEIIGKFNPIITGGDKKFTREEFGDKVIIFEDWFLDFKFSSHSTLPEAYLD